MERIAWLKMEVSVGEMNLLLRYVFCAVKDSCLGSAF